MLVPTLVLWLAALPAGVAPEGAAPLSAAVPTATTVEVLPRPPTGALEEGLSGEVARFYAAGIAAIRSASYRRALTAVRQARALAYHELQSGPTPPRLARRHFARILYLEEQLSELTLIDEQLERPPDRSDLRSGLLQLRALHLHNMFLAVRGFLGITDGRLLGQTLKAYQLALDDADNLKHALLIGHAAMLAERGFTKQARLTFAKLTEHEREQETMDVAVAYYYLALGDRDRAISRLIDASRRDTWLHGSPTREGHSFRSQVYYMNDFDRLRDHPRFQELVTIPEEQ